MIRLTVHWNWPAIGLGVPIYNALHEWLPIMKREKERALRAQKEEKE